MRKYCLILALTLILGMFSFLIWFLSWDDVGISEVPFAIQIAHNGASETVNCWLDANGSVHVFLPAWASVSEARFVLRTDSRLAVNGKQILDGTSFDVLEPEEEYLLTIESFFGVQEKSFFIHRTNETPALFVDTFSGSMDSIHLDKDNFEQGSYRLYNSSGEEQAGGLLERIEGRGNGTWKHHEKKPYNVSLEFPADLLGMGAATQWILLADAGDASRMRNKLILDYAEEVGLSYSPQCRWVDLYLNGAYAGVYLLCERNELHPERVSALGEGSFLVSLDLQSRLEELKHPYVSVSSGQYLRVHKSSREDLDLIKARMQSVENAILSPDGVDARTGVSLETLIDMDSWVRKYLIEEVFGNLDGCVISQFFYYDADDPCGKVYAGPVWDYDASLGNENNWQLGSPRRWFGNRLVVREGLQIPWFYSLCRNKSFFDLMVNTYQQDYVPKLENLLSSGLQRYCDEIRDSWYMDRIRWNGGTGDIEQEAANIANYLQQRMVFLHDAWVLGTEYLTVTVDASPGNAYAYYSILPGENLAEIFVPDDRSFRGWFVSGTDAPFDPSLPIYEDIHIYARFQRGNSVALMVVIIFVAAFIWVTAAAFSRIRKVGG